METWCIILSVLCFSCGGKKKKKTSDLSNTNNLIWKEAHYFPIDIENESGTKNETVTVQETADLATDNRSILPCGAEDWWDKNSLC